jgi:hypothetical protein
VIQYLFADENLVRQINCILIKGQTVVTKSRFDEPCIDLVVLAVVVLFAWFVVVFCVGGCSPLVFGVVGIDWNS